MFVTLIILWAVCVAIGAMMVFRGPDPEPIDLHFEEGEDRPNGGTERVEG